MWGLRCPGDHTRALGKVLFEGACHAVLPLEVDQHVVRLHQLDQPFALEGRRGPPLPLDKTNKNQKKENINKHKFELWLYVILSRTREKSPPPPTEPKK